MVRLPRVIRNSIRTLITTKNKEWIYPLPEPKPKKKIDLSIISGNKAPIIRANRFI